MSWQARLQLDYALEQGRCVARHVHEGPLRVLKSLYPEGDAICHNVLVHPPGGLVGGDYLDLSVTVGAGAHGLLTTPGATRFYRSEGATATQRLHATVAKGGRLEWLPLEAIAYPGCRAHSEARFALAPGAELLAWDITALGLPQAGAPFERGEFSQHLELQGAWLERGRLRADDGLLLDGALGLAGRRCMASLVFAAGTAISRERRERALDAARALISAAEGQVLPEAGPPGLPLMAGVSAAHPQVLVLRALAPLTEASFALLRSCWALWRKELWGLDGQPPRIWAM
ncbi:urease accessory protein UreD [Paucibacter sp. APW11]|uniref:Urease accessory protein UreD n=1 Tax=Roseateles aquae TaxID=3077235 RepID=A0ABU3PFV4_9BURK|nr:urease accessory protein UreD [Paucibacter sp. APW11]MDT9001480.1 urease accessory protein UreD [Paucibacter sp. APW11]